MNRLLACTLATLTLVTSSSTLHAALAEKGARQALFSIQEEVLYDNTPWDEDLYGDTYSLFQRRYPKLIAHYLAVCTVDTLKQESAVDTFWSACDKACVVQRANTSDQERQQIYDHGATCRAQWNAQYGELEERYTKLCLEYEKMLPQMVAHVLAYHVAISDQQHQSIKAFLAAWNKCDKTITQEQYLALLGNTMATTGG